MFETAEKLKEQRKNPQEKVPSEQKEVPLSEEEKNNQQEKMEHKEYELEVAELKEEQEKLQKIDELEKKSGLNLDETQEEIAGEIKNLEKEIGDFQAEHHPETKADLIEKEMPDIPIARKEKRENEIKEIIAQYVEEIKLKMIQHIDSPEYLKKLTLEYYGDKETAEKNQKLFMENLRTVKLDLLTLENLQIRAKYEYGMVIREGEEVGGLYHRNKKDKRRDHTVSLPYDLDFFRENQKDLTLEEAAIHELLHAATKAEVSPKATKLFKESYIPQNDGRDNYFAHSPERLNRKQKIDRELEDLGIKKYGEFFTEEHYKKMMEAYEDGKFSDDADNFIKRTIKNPKIFMQIFNEIAKNEEEKENPSSSV